MTECSCHCGVKVEHQGKANKKNRIRNRAAISSATIVDCIHSTRWLVPAVLLKSIGMQVVQVVAATSLDMCPCPNIRAPFSQSRVRRERSNRLG